MSLKYWRGVILSYPKLLSLNWTREAEENREESQSRFFVTQGILNTVISLIKGRLSILAQT
jgi:hypothetical protein